MKKSNSDIFELKNENYYQLFGSKNKSIKKVQKELITRLRTRERVFNKILISNQKVKKFIYDINKGKQEIYFYKNIPKIISGYFPKLYSSSSQKDLCSYTISFISGLDASVFYSHNLMTMNTFTHILREIENFYFLTPKKFVSKADYIISTQNLVLAKMNSRWRLYKKSATFKEVSKKFKKTSHKSAELLKLEVEKLLKKKIKEHSNNFLYFSHGDLCFSNIILDGNQTLKFIDPRGGLALKDLYLTPYYDLAKLSQCVFGHYDGIISGRKINFKAQQTYFERWLQKNNYDLKFVRLVESSLFLSMLPLHMDQVEIHSKFLQSALSAFEASK